jgi:hypothetical protein
MYGVTIWEIFTYCDQPWPNLNSNEIFQKIGNENQRLPLPYLCSKDFYSIVLACWSKNQSDRPSFEILKKLIKETKIIEMKAKTEFKQDNRLEIDQGDVITIIEGNAEKYWWKGQNNRTMIVGHFPRAILNPQRHLTGEDISLPLKNSFIHTGHMSAGPSEKTWGSPGKIDEIFLANPLNPPDLIQDLTESNEPTKAETNIQIIDKPLIANNNSSNLIDLLDIKLNYPNDDNKVRVTYPDYSASLDSFESPSSTQSSQSSSTPINMNNNQSLSAFSSAFNNSLTADSNIRSPSISSPVYINENQNQYSNNFNTQVQLENENYYNINMNYKKVLHENSFPVYKSNSPVFNYNANNALNLNPVNPLFNSSFPQNNFNSYTRNSTSSFIKSGGVNNQFVSKKQEENSKKSKVDDLLDQMISMNINLL